VILIEQTSGDVKLKTVHCFDASIQWIKCNGTQWNAVTQPPIYGSKRSSTLDCYKARKGHTTIVRGPNLDVAFPRL